MSLRRLPVALREGWYRVVGRGPVPEAGDRVLAERIRSVLGPLERRLGVDPVAVTVVHGVAVLTGMMPDGNDMARLVAAAEGIHGVREVRSHAGPAITDPVKGTAPGEGAG